MTELKTVTAYDDFRAKIAEVKDTCNFLPDVSTDDGYAKSKRVSLDVGKILTSVEKTRKELKAESLERGRMIDSEAKLIVKELEEFQLPHKEAYKELDNLKKEREANRKAELDERVRVIRELPEAMADSDSEGVKMALESLQVEECLDFYEFTQEALKARNASRNALAKMFADKLQAEKDAKELAELRKKQAEQEQKDREDAIAKQAAEKAEAEAAAAKAAEQAAIEQAAEAVKQREAAEAQAAKDAEAAEARRIETEKQAEIDKAAAESQAKIYAENAAKAAKAQAEAEQKAKELAELEATEKREANKRHVGGIRKAAKESLMALDIDEALAKKIVMAINDGEIANVSISY